MSYLDLPRLHFSGLFYTNPNTINNATGNYTPTVDLELPSPPNPPDQYNKNVVFWNPLGVAQWWLEECTVLSAVGPSGAAADASDPVIGAAVTSPSPKTPMEDGTGGYYDIAKMVDLDPDQQGRSAVYGLRLAVALPNGAGFQGLMTVPELRQLNPRIAGARGSWGFVGNWMGTLQDVKWSGDLSGSPLLTALQAAGAQGLAVKLTVDLHQNNPANVFTAGDIFCYGRVLGSIGPALAGELAQVVPGRCLQTYTPPKKKDDAESVAASSASSAPAAADAHQEGKTVVQGRERVARQTQALGEQRAARGLTDGLGAALAATPPPDPWNPAFAVVRQADSQTLLSLDIGGCILLNASPPYDPTANPPVRPNKSDGTFEVESGITVGVYDLGSKQFVPFANGDIDFTPQYQPSNSSSKDCQLVKNSGVFTIPLTEADGDAYQTNPLAIQVNGATVAMELATGLWADVSVSSQRLECGGGQAGQAQIMVRAFGNAPPANTTPPVTVVLRLVNWSSGSPKLSATSDVSVTLGLTDSDGLASVTTAINVPDISLPPTRQPLDSQVYYVFLLDANNNVIGDGSPTLSVLLWDAYQAPASPTWENDVALDISDEATVLGFAGVVLGHMGLPFTDPAYMPVTRDLSPSKMAMITSWLKQVSQQSAADGSQKESES